MNSGYIDAKTRKELLEMKVNDYNAIQQKARQEVNSEKYFELLLQLYKDILKLTAS